MNDIRQQQVEAGRDALRPRKLHISSGSNKKSAPKGHEAFLKALETSGAIVSFEKASGDIVEGKIKHSDKYTVSVIDGEFTRVLFKHDISEFRAITPRVQE